MEIYGTNGNDLLTGTNTRNDIEGRAGDDTLLGMGGNDDLYGGAGDDILDGGAGDDEMNGGAGADLFRYSAGRDRIEGLTFEDRIEIASGFGIVDFAALMALARPAEGGDSTLFNFGNGNTLLIEDVRMGQLTAAQFGFAAAPLPSNPPQASPGGAHQGDDVLNGTGGLDRINGLGGNDLIRGLGGNDEL